MYPSGDLVLPGLAKEMLASGLAGEKWRIPEFDILQVYVASLPASRRKRYLRTKMGQHMPCNLKYLVDAAEVKSVLRRVDIQNNDYYSAEV